MTYNNWLILNNFIFSITLNYKVFINQIFFYNRVFVFLYNVEIVCELRLYTNLIKQTNNSIILIILYIF